MATTIAMVLGSGMLSLRANIAQAAGSPTNADLLYNSANGNVWIDSAEAANQILVNFILTNDPLVLPDFSPVALFPEEVNGTYTRFTTSVFEPEEISWTDELIFTVGSTWASEIGAGAIYDMGTVFPPGLNLTQLTSFLIDATYVGDLGTGIQAFDLVLINGFEWNVDASGNWNTASNWLPLTVPNAQTANVTFGSAITAPRMVTTTSSVTVTSLTFDNLNNYTIAGTGGVNFAADTGNASLRVLSGGTSVASAHGFLPRSI